jgi:hypothetical protein
VYYVNRLNGTVQWEAPPLHSDDREWIVSIDPVSQVPFYYDSQSGESTWEFRGKMPLPPSTLPLPSNSSSQSFFSEVSSKISASLADNSKSVDLAPYHGYSSASPTRSPMKSRIMSTVQTQYHTPNDNLSSAGEGGEGSDFDDDGDGDGAGNHSPLKVFARQGVETVAALGGLVRKASLQAVEALLTDENLSSMHRAASATVNVTEGIVGFFGALEIQAYAKQEGAAVDNAPQPLDKEEESMRELMTTRESAL